MANKIQLASIDLENWDDIDLTTSSDSRRERRPRRDFNEEAPAIRKPRRQATYKQLTPETAH